MTIKQRLIRKFLYFLGWIWTLISHTKISVSEDFKRQKGMIIVANHTSSLDAVTRFYTLGTDVNAVIAENMIYNNPVFSWFIRHYGGILKKQFTADYSCVKLIKQNINDGFSVIICPEGRVSEVGVTRHIPSSIAKMIKWLNAPVGYIVDKGVALTAPKWGGNLRIGKISSECGVLFSANEVKEKSVKQIHDAICEKLKNNDHAYQLEHNLRFRSKNPAKGLEKLLYHCPSCGKDYRLKSNKALLTCYACGAVYRYDEYGHITSFNAKNCPPRIDSWYFEQQAIVENEVKKPDFCEKQRVKAYVSDPTKLKFVPLSSGSLTLDIEKLDYIPDDNGAKLSFPITQHSSLGSVPGTVVYAYQDNRIYKFQFIDALASMKYVLAADAAAKLKQT